MNLNNYQFFKKKETLILILLLLISVSVRIPVILIIGDISIEHEWKTLVNNLIVHGKLSFTSFDGFLIPSAYMPPLYSYYLYFLSIFNFEEKNYIQLILSSQILLSSISVVVFYKINKLFFSQKISFYSSLLFSLFPLHLYACGQISSISLQTFFTILFFYFFFQLAKKKNLFSIILFSFVAGLLLLLRGEFIMILALSLLYLFLFFNIRTRNILLILLFTLITISPYLVRNILVLETITITKSLGINLWKGNNPNSKVEGTDLNPKFQYFTLEDSVLITDDLRIQINSIPKDKFYEIKSDKVFLDRAIMNISNEPKKYLILFFEKFASFLFIDIKSSQPNYYNPLHYLPVLLLGVTALIGIFLSDKKSYQLNYLILIFFVNIIIFSSFFILPRYKLVILPLQIIFTNVLIEYVKKRFFYRYE